MHPPSGRRNRNRLAGRMIIDDTGAAMQSIKIRVRGKSDEDWIDWFGELSVCRAETGETVISGPVQDQSAVYGLIARLSVLGLQLCSIRVYQVDLANRKV